MCLCLGCDGEGGAGGSGGSLIHGLGGWRGVMCVCVAVNLDYLLRWQVQVYVYCSQRLPTCPSYVHPVFNPVALYRYLLPNMYLSVVDIANPDFLGCCCRTCNIHGISRFYEQQCQPSSGSAWLACLKTVNRAPIVEGRKGQHTAFCMTCSLLMLVED